MPFQNDTIKQFLDALASDAPAPGGGSVAALSGALGAALVTMVSNLTIGREKYRENWAAMEVILEASNCLLGKFLKLMDEDTEAFNEFMAAMKLPRNTDVEKEVRNAAIAEASKKVTEVPLATLERCAEIAELAAKAAKLGNPNTASDAGSAALMAEAAGKAAAYNVRINLPGIKDEEFEKSIRERLYKALSSIDDSCQSAEETMDKLLK
jgi:glutamate formiminotransferase/formiminotetrahydrofolate cyclodeaminase